MPFALEEPDVLPLLRNISNKIINKDIPSVIPLKTEEPAVIEKVLTFIGKSSVEDINYSTAAKNVGITKYKAEQYIHLLEKAFLLTVVFPSGTNVLKEPKILLFPPYRLLFRGFNDAIGGLREDFFVCSLTMLGLPFSYLKSTRGAKTPDYSVRTGTGDLIVEIGGKGKGREQFKGIDMEKSLILTHPSSMDGIKRPLFMMGYV